MVESGHQHIHTVDEEFELKNCLVLDVKALCDLQFFDFRQAYNAFLPIINLMWFTDATLQMR